MFANCFGNCICTVWITTRSWRAGAKLVQEDLGVSITGASKDFRSQLLPFGSHSETVKKPLTSSDVNSRLNDLVKIDAGWQNLCANCRLGFFFILKIALM